MHRIDRLASFEWLYIVHSNQEPSKNGLFQKFDFFSWAPSTSSLVDYYLSSKYKESIISKIVFNVYNADGCEKIWCGSKNRLDKNPKYLIIGIMHKTIIFLKNAYVKPINL